MKFGIVHAELFDPDPIRHIDLARSTIAIDSALTNIAMWNHSADSWDGIRSALCQVPFHHPFWRVDLSLGKEIWKGQWDRTITPSAPIPAFDMRLLPIDIWFSGTLSSSSNFKCEECSTEFNNSGSLILHCRQDHTHSAPAASPPSASGSTRQDEIDDAHWDTCLTCPVCTTKFNTSGNLQNHMRTHSGERPYKCNSAFAMSGTLQNHMRIHSGERPYKRDKCDSAFTTSGNLQLTYGHIQEKGPTSVTNVIQLSSNQAISRFTCGHIQEKGLISVTSVIQLSPRQAISRITCGYILEKGPTSVANVIQLSPRQAVSRSMCGSILEKGPISVTSVIRLSTNQAISRLTCRYILDKGPTNVTSVIGLSRNRAVSGDICERIDERCLDASKIRGLSAILDSSTP